MRKCRYQTIFVLKKLLLIIYILPIITFSQVDGELNGFIFDSKSQLPLLGANIIIEGTDKGAISNEDGFFCVLHRKFLEGKGFKWATFQTAQRFSIETPINLRSLINLNALHETNHIHQMCIL